MILIPLAISGSKFTAGSFTSHLASFFTGATGGKIIGFKEAHS